MRRFVLTYGLISGGIIIVLGFINTNLWKAGVVNFDNAEIIGYASMLIALSMVFFGIKAFRDRHQGGVVRFGKAFLVGLLITLVASSVYVAGWEVYWQMDDELRRTFMDRYTEHVIEKLRAEGTRDEEIQARREEMDHMKELYNVRILRLAFTLVEILPVGLLVTLVSAAILRRKEFLPG
ncbi:MAG: DUF4199 domain-containing protein [Ignavibacteriales bacterium]|nr:DUF4199 domain-containing protein [Ignavibacteriales bacterium]